MSTAMKYRKKPVVNEAMQWRADNLGELSRWAGGSNLRLQPGSGRDVLYLYVAANGTWLPLEPGEWVIRDSKGFYPCKADVFAATYERVVGPRNLPSSYTIPSSKLAI